MSADENPMEALLRALFPNMPRKMEDFSRVAKIEDDRALLIEAAMKQKKTEMDAAEHVFLTLKAELAGLQGRLFMRLHEVYPAVPRNGAEVVKHKGDLYYVGMNED